MIKAIIKKYIPYPILKGIRKLSAAPPLRPPINRVTMGDYNRLTPFSTSFGFDRGGAIDRYYIENFLEREAECIHGRVLEIGDNFYTSTYGGQRVTRSDILHVNEDNPAATIVGDISNAPQIPEYTFDCIILTQTLHLIYDFKSALRTCHRILKPGGALLMTVPYITSIDYGEWNSTWYWAFTDKVFEPLMQETFPGGYTEVNSYGNVLTASAFLYGMGLPELTKAQLESHDPHFQLIITVKSIKSSASV